MLFTQTSYNAYSDFKDFIWNFSLILLCHTVHSWSMLGLLTDKQKGWQNIPHLWSAFFFILKNMEKIHHHLIAWNIYLEKQRNLKLKALHHTPFWDENLEDILLTLTLGFLSLLKGHSAFHIIRCNIMHFEAFCQNYIFKNKNEITGNRFFWLGKRGLKTNFLFPGRLYFKIMPVSSIKYKY